jgi:hypothetical protein
MIADKKSKGPGLNCSKEFSDLLQQTNGEYNDGLEMHYGTLRFGGKLLHETIFQI